MKVGYFKKEIQKRFPELGKTVIIMAEINENGQKRYIVQVYSRIPFANVPAEYFEAIEEI